MDRILALQGLTSFEDELTTAPGVSNQSGVCSLQSSGQGGSSCSIACAQAQELEW
jgi:hypothetical protein